MRLPAVAIATAFAWGIAFGLYPAVARNASSRILLSSFFIFIGVLVLTGIVLVAGTTAMGLWLRDRAFGRRIRGGSATAILENFRVAKLWIGREVPIPALARLEEFARE
jgi:hypothetical protein